MILMIAFLLMFNFWMQTFTLQIEISDLECFSVVKWTLQLPSVMVRMATRCHHQLHALNYLQSELLSFLSEQSVCINQEGDTLLYQRGSSLLPSRYLYSYLHHPFPRCISALSNLLRFLAIITWSILAFRNLRISVDTVTQQSVCASPYFCQKSSQFLSNTDINEEPSEFWIRIWTCANTLIEHNIIYSHNRTQQNTIEFAFSHQD